MIRVTTFDTVKKPYDQYGGIEHAPEWLLRYIAPMWSGERERAELCRRIQTKEGQ